MPISPPPVPSPPPCSRRGKPGALMLTLLTVLLLTGCAPTESIVERGIQRELPRIVGPAERYEVDVGGINLLSGQAQRITAVGTRVQPEGAPLLERVDVELRDVTYNRREKRMERVGHALITAQVTDAALTAFLETHRHLQEVSVTLEPPDQVAIRARPELSGIEIPAGLNLSVAGRLIRAGQEVNYEISEARAVGIGLGNSVAGALTEAINPLIDLSKVPVVLEVTEMRVQDGAISVSATGSYPRK